LGMGFFMREGPEEVRRTEKGVGGGRKGGVKRTMRKSKEGPLVSVSFVKGKKGWGGQ